MYYPLLRGKQYELIALKEFAEANPENTFLCPIIEPVRVLNDALVRAAGVLSKNRINYCVILNPVRGDYAIQSSRFEVPAFLEKFEGLDIKPIPAFYADGKCAEVQREIEYLGLKDVMIIFEESFDMEIADSLCTHDSVSYIVCFKADSKSNSRYLMKTGKNIIRLDDRFIVRKPNTAYRGVDEDAYSEEFYYYKEDKFYGFSDYCVLSKEFIEGGTTPTAIAIHLSYRKREDAIWVRHFVSDEAFDTQNIRSKFGNAMKHLKEFYAETNTKPTQAVQQLIDNSGKYPGLGVLKKVTVLSHIQLISTILSSIEKQ